MPSRGTELHGMILANKSHGSHMPSEFTSLYESVDSEFCENDFVQKSQLREGWGAHGEQLTLLALRMPTGLKEKHQLPRKPAMSVRMTSCFLVSWYYDEWPPIPMQRASIEFNV